MDLDDGVMNTTIGALGYSSFSGMARERISIT
jgi:hypothetical protein